MQEIKSFEIKSFLVESSFLTEIWEIRLAKVRNGIYYAEGKNRNGTCYYPWHTISAYNEYEACEIMQDKLNRRVTFEDMYPQE
jgi:hypothetical protein